ncbi:hypothetical protein [Oceanobacillus jeddahense]|uniref:hypothetical protein n=1 Tax=Oceanobacillus jeddahense TaxID=1462527 RepID=UPI0005960FB0|nr:hypothetical protein [Oceanobacillus jeddahense]
MLLSRWTLFQWITIIFLEVFAFLADMFRTEVTIPISSGTETNGSMVIAFLFLVAVIGLLSLLMYFQTKKSSTFLKHPL